MKLRTPAQVDPQLKYMAVEVSWGSTWENIHDGVRFTISGDQTRDSSSKQWRKTQAESPVLGGSYLVHAVPSMVTEQIGVWIYGVDQADLNENFALLTQLFEQSSYRIRWTLDNYREYWNCQLADATYARGRIWTNNLMALVTFSVPRFPDITREQI